MQKSAANDLPTTPGFVAAGTAPAASLSPTDRTSFVFAGVAEQPEMFINEGSYGDGAPLHRHPWASWEIVLEGRVRFVVNEQEIVANAGDFVYTPPGAAHTYVVESERSRMVGFNHPSRGFAELQQRAEALFRDGPPDLPKLVELAGRYELEILGPPLAPKP